MSDARFSTRMIRVVAVRLLRIVAAFFLTFAIARLLNAEDAGAYFLAASFAQLVALVSLLGTDQSLTRATAARVARSELDELSGEYHAVVRLVIFVAIAGAMLMVAASPLLARWLAPGTNATATIAIAGVAVIPLAILVLHAQLLIGLDRVEISITLQWIAVPLLTVAAITIISRVDASAPIAAACYLAALSAVAAVTVIRWRKSANLPAPSGQGTRSSPLLRVGFSMFVIANSAIVSDNITNLLLGAFGDPADIATFRVAARVALISGAVLNATTAVLTPRLAGLWARGDVHQVGVVARRGGRLAAAAALPIVIVSVAFPQVILSVFGSDFETGASVLAILAVANGINAAAGVPGLVLAMTAYERVMRNLTIMSLTTFTVAAFILTPMFGVIGTAVASLLSTVLRNVLAVYMVRRCLGLQVLPFLPGEKHGAQPATEVVS